VEVIHKRTDGNPFFVGEVTRQVTLENITQDDEWASIIPEGVRDAIGRRLNRVSDQCNHMLTTASIIGREFDFRLLIILSGGVSEDQLLQAVDEALSVHLIEDVRGPARHSNAQRQTRVVRLLGAAHLEEPDLCRGH